MARGLRSAVVGVLTLAGIAAFCRSWRQRRRPNDGENTSPNTPTLTLARDVARWEDEGGSVTT